MTPATASLGNHAARYSANQRAGGKYESQAGRGRLSVELIMIGPAFRSGTHFIVRNEAN